MNAILQFNKRKYETPLEMLGRLRIEQPYLQNEKLSYLGRLDPLAHGIMLVAVGEVNKDREKYLGLPKTYNVKFLFGMSTDTGDLLGFIKNVQDGAHVDRKKIEKDILSLKGKHKLLYPLYSSKTVNGKPLHEYGREGKDVILPERDMEVLSVHIKDAENIQSEKIFEAAIYAVENVKGDFRQEMIRKIWEEFLGQHTGKNFLMVETILFVTGGTYIRSLADLLAEKTGIPCLAFDIERTEIFL